MTSRNAVLHAALRYSLRECKNSVTCTVCCETVSCPRHARGRRPQQLGTGVTIAVALHPPRLHLVGFGVGREDGRLQPRPVQLVCFGKEYLYFQKTNWIGPNCCAVWPNHVRLVANHMAFWFLTGYLNTKRPSLPRITRCLSSGPPRHEGLPGGTGDHAIGWKRPSKAHTKPSSVPSKTLLDGLG